MREWSADVVVDEGLARRLIGQFPGLDSASLRPLAEGWDYAIWVVDETWAFRFPRREYGVPGTRREIAVMPVLGPELPLPVPVPVFVGVPTDEFPWPFFGSRFLAGRELAEVELDAEARERVARQLAGFLRKLHALPLADVLPVDPNGRSEMSSRVPKAREELAGLEAAGLWEAPPHLEEIFADAQGLPPVAPVAVTHGDLHIRQVLADGGGLTGVVDWVDLGRSDPAIDLSLYWSLFDEPEREVFRTVYGRITEEQLLRARVLALWLNCVLARYGRVEGFSPLERAALAGLDRTAGHA